MAGLAVGFGAVQGGVLVYRELAAGLPVVTSITDYRTSAPGVSQIHSAEGILLAEVAREHRAYATLRDVPDSLKNAFIAAEDRRFYEHGGLDYRGLARAALANLRSGTVVQGGSTITQQVAKGFLSHDRTLGRKLREAILSLRLESLLTKDQILEIYLNKIFLGHGAYGVGAAASRYFDKKLDQLTLAESALIAGLARAPSRYSPVVRPDRALARRRVVLRDMVEAGIIDAQAFEQADAEPLRLSRATDVFRLRAPYYAEHVRKLVTERLGEKAVLEEGLTIETAARVPLHLEAHAAADRVLRQIDRRQGFRGPITHLRDEAARNEFIERLRRESGAELVRRADERYVVGLVTQIQRFRAIVEVGGLEAELPLENMRWAAPYDHNSGQNDLTIEDVREALEPGDVVFVRGTTSRRGADPASTRPLVELGQTPRVEAAIFTMENDTGYVTTVEGGRDYDASQFNRTTQACRQPGSVFKAIYYALALSSDEFAMDTVLEDKPYVPEPGEDWNPQNLHNTLDGKVLVRTALIHSLNLPSIRLFQRLGADRVAQFARSMGFSTELIADKALSLGASCVRMDELTRAFSIFERGGLFVEPIYVRRITDKRGNVLWDERAPQDASLDVGGRLDAMARQVLSPPRAVVDPVTSFLITRLLREVVTAGLGKRAQRLEAPVAGKTGTASKKLHTTDTWFVGFTSRHSTAAWVGDDDYERSLGDEEASYTTAMPLWTDYMAKVIGALPHEKLPVFRPDGIVSRQGDARTGGEPIPGLPQATFYSRK